MVNFWDGMGGFLEVFSISLLISAIAMVMAMKYQFFRYIVILLWSLWCSFLFCFALSRIVDLPIGENVEAFTSEDFRDKAAEERRAFAGITKTYYMALKLSPQALPWQTSEDVLLNVVSRAAINNNITILQTILTQGRVDLTRPMPYQKGVTLFDALAWHYYDERQCLNVEIWELLYQYGMPLPKTFTFCVDIPEYFGVFLVKHGVTLIDNRISCKDREDDKK